MNHIAAIALLLIWMGGNFYLWSLKQSQGALLAESLVMFAIAFPALFWYATRDSNNG